MMKKNAKKMNKTTKLAGTIPMLALAAGMLLVTVGCEDEPDTVGEHIEEAGEELGDEIDDAVDDASDNVEDGLDEVDDSRDDAGGGLEG